MSAQSEKAIRILELSRDGDELQALDLRLVEMAVNGHLNAAGLEAFDRLHAEVTSGAYKTKHHWFQGIEHLTQDTRGYVYWKGTSVEHFDFREQEPEAAAAHRLVEKCRKLEANGFPVNGRTVLQKACYNAEAGTPWQLALTHYYTFARKEDQVVGIFYVRYPDSEDTVVTAQRTNGSIQLAYYQWAHEALHALQKQGLTSTGAPDDYPEAVAMLAATGLSASEVDKIINAMSPADRLSVLYNR
jgi:hypothetical protein